MRRYDSSISKTFHHLASRCYLLAALTGATLVAQGWTDASQAVAQTAKQQKTVTGQIVDPTGEPLIGVTVMVEGKASTGTISDFDGNYTIKVSEKDKLQFRYIGFQSQVISVAGKTKINVKMQDDSADLEEVVVVGFGQTKKASLTGAVSTVSSEQFESKGSLSSPIEALQGQVPGVIVTRSSSAPGDEGWNMKLRGSVSMNSDNNDSPLCIVDGVVGDINTVNSADIESINFLKDGSAAIYGSRAANGVIIVTTKKGKEGKVNVNYGFSATLKTPGLQPKTMSIDEWADGLMQCLRNDGETSNEWYTYAQLAKLYKGKYLDLSQTISPFGDAKFNDVDDFVFSETDWLGGMFGNAWNQEHNLNVSGGNDKNVYRIALAYNYDGSNLKFGNNNMKRYNFRVSDTYNFTKRLKLESNIAYLRKTQVIPTDIDHVLTTSLPQPGLPMAALNGNAYAWGTWGSPVAKAEQGGDKKTNVSRIDISETLTWDPTDWLTANVNFGYNTSSKNVDEEKKSIKYYNITGTKVTLTDPTQDNSYYQELHERIDNYSITGYVNGHKKFGDHNTSLTLGTQYEFKEYDEMCVRAKNIQDGLEVVNGTGDITIPTSYNKKYQTALLSYFFRANYDYLGRYLLEANGRYDGSSKFLPENRWAFFWGISAGWRINEENFLKDVNWLTNLKLRASYAQVGNQSGIGNYDGVQLYNLKSNTGAYLGSDLASYIVTDGTFASKTRSWERIHNYNIALDFGFKIAPGHNINGTVEYFQKRNNNMLVSVTLPATLGDNAPSANAGKFKDYGWEGQVTYNGHIGEVKINAGGTLTFARNKLTEYQGTTVLSSGYHSNYVGYGLSSLFGLRYAGKIQNEEQRQAYLALYYNNNAIGMPAEIRVGDNMYCDENGDGKLDENDYIYLGSSNPEISYSFNIGASWKGIDVSFVFQGAANRYIYRGSSTNWTVPYRARYQNCLQSSIGNVWTEDNPDAYYSPYTSNSEINTYNYQPSSLTAQNGAYLRLKTISIGYNFPKTLLKKTKFIQNLRAYFTATDLWETTKIGDGWDPESKIGTSGTTLYPFTRNFTFGLNIGF